MNLLLIGDPHVRKSDREEFARIVVWALDLCKKYDAYPFFLGDQYNDFGIARLECMEFWDYTFRMLLANMRRAGALTGNHDINGDASASAMTVHTAIVDVIDRNGTMLGNGIGAIGFVRDNKEFLKKVHELSNRGARTIFCHAEFEGSQYDNGFYSPNGVPVAALPQDVNFISGHIHKQQEFGRIWYPGTSRHLTRSDIGEVKGVWLYDTVTGKRTFFETPESVSQKFVQLEIKEGGKVPDVPDSPRVFVDVKGSDEFIQKVCKKLPDSVKVRAFPEDRQKAAIEIKESEGLPTAFRKFASSYIADKGLSDSMARKIITEIYSRCPSLKVGVSNGPA